METNMSEAGNLEVKGDGNDDIYKDIGDFHFDRELVKLEECNKAYSEEIKTLSAKVTLLTERNTELESVNDILATNISILLKTAKAEIQRKQLVIDELRKMSEDATGRYDFNIDNLGLCKICGSKISRDNVNALEEGEIVKSKSEEEEEDVRSERGSHRNHRSKDRREHSGNRKKRKKSRERSRGRSSDKYSSRSHRSSRRSESRSHYSRSSRSRPRYKSPDERRHSHRSRRSREKSHSWNYARKSSSQKREYISHGKDISSRREERSKSQRDRVSNSCSKVISPARESSKKPLRETDKTEKSSDSTGTSRPSGSVENKNNVFKSDSNVRKNREEEKDKGKTETQKKEKTDPVKKLNKNDYHDRRGDHGNGCNTAAKDSQNNSFTRQSILADLYDETIFCNKFSDAPRTKSTHVRADYDNGLDSSSDESWTLSFGKRPQVSNKPKTLYSRRMEMRLKQKLKEDKTSSEGKCSEINPGNQEKKLEEKPVCVEEEKEEGEITFDNDEEEQAAEDVVRKEEVSEKNTGDAPVADENSQALDKIFAGETCAKDAESEKPENTGADKDCEQSLGENIIKRLLELQDSEETSGIKEFSPLKNNYKLSKISPLKSVQKQHILDYYNLKPAQQLNNIEPEILDFSFSVPETPGKNFSNPFGTLDSQESLKDNEDDKLETLEGELRTSDVNSHKVTEVNERNDCNPIEEATECPKVDNGEKVASPEGKKLGRTRAKRKLRPSTVEEKQTDSTQVTAKDTKDKDPVTYQIRTRSRTGNENGKCTREVNYSGEKKGRTLNKTKSVPAKRKRGVVSSEEEAKEEQELKIMRKKANNGPESEISKSNNEELVVKEVENDKELTESKTEDVSKTNENAYFEVFQSVTEAADEVPVEEKNPLEELSLSNISDYRATNTSCSDTQNKLMCTNESKLSALSTGNSGDSSTFQVLRSYFMLSANEESDVEAFSEDATSSSGEYSDSGASAFVDLL